MKEKELRGAVVRVLALALAFAAVGGLLGHGLQEHPGVAVLTLAALVFGAATLTDWGRTLLPADGDAPGTYKRLTGRRVTCDFGHRVTVWMTDGTRTPRRLLARRPRARIELETPDPACPSCQQLERQLEAALNQPGEKELRTAEGPDLPPHRGDVPTEGDLLGPDNDAPTCRFGHRVTVETVYNELGAPEPGTQSSGAKIKLVTQDPTCPGCQWLRQHVESALQRIQEQEAAMAETESRTPTRSDAPAEAGVRRPTRSGVPAEIDARALTRGDVPDEHSVSGHDNETLTCDFGHPVIVGMVYGDPTAVDLATGGTSVRVELVTPDGSCPGCRRLYRQVEGALRAARERGSLAKPVRASLTEAPA